MESRTVFILAGLAAVGYAVAQSSKKTTTSAANSTPTNPNSVYIPPSPQPTGSGSTPTGTTADVINAASNAWQTGKDLVGQLFPPTKAPEMPSLYPVNTPVYAGSGTAPATAPSAVDKYGMRHAPGADTARADSFNASDGAVYKMLSDYYKIYFEDVDALIGHDMSLTHNSWSNIMIWYSQKPEHLPLADYNRTVPAAAAIKARW